MKITINGEEREFPAPDGPLKVEQLLETLELGYPVLVELNGQALFKRELAERDVREGDSLELMRMVAGG